MLLCVSCKKDSYYDAVAQKINQVLENELNQYDYVIIIPGAGCTGCITNAENYF
jgi:hypothetical protein